MGLGTVYWIVAWVMMVVAFATAAGSILIGARNLDRQSLKRRDN